MSLEDTLGSWTAPSSTSEQEKQDRTERMVRRAIDAHAPFAHCVLSVYAKGSYANNTNVRADSDVDVAVECTEVEYWEEERPGARTTGIPYTGPWTPENLRSELVRALKAKFPGQVDATGSTAIQINSNSARVEADVVPCFSYRYYFSSGGSREGTKLFTTTGKSIVNFPAQQLRNGTDKNNRTGRCYKKAVRILKRVENAMVSDSAFWELSSYFIECLTYNCPDAIFRHPTWTATVRAMLVHIWESLEGEEPSGEGMRWLEVNECLYLFHSGQEWWRNDGRDFAYGAWNYLGYGS